MDKQKVRRAPRLLGRAASVGGPSVERGTSAPSARRDAAVRAVCAAHAGERSRRLCAVRTRDGVRHDGAGRGTFRRRRRGLRRDAASTTACSAAFTSAAALIVLCVMSVCTGLRVVQRPWFAPAVAAAAGAACTFIFLPAGDGAARAGRDDLSRRAGTDVRRVPAFTARRSLRRARKATGADRSTLLAVTATVLLSVSRPVSLFGLFAPARAAALLLVLGTAYLGGPAAGAAAGVAFGAVMDLGVG